MIRNVFGISIVHFGIHVLKKQVNIFIHNLNFMISQNHSKNTLNATHIWEIKLSKDQVNIGYAKLDLWISENGSTQ